MKTHKIDKFDSRFIVLFNNGVWLLYIHSKNKLYTTEIMVEGDIDLRLNLFPGVNSHK